MAFIKKFRNGKIVDSTVSAPIQQPLPVPIPIPVPQPPTPTVPPHQITSPTPPLPKVVPRRGGCGCGKK